MYVGDTKMAASGIRAGIEYARDYYLTPLPATIIPIEVLDTYLKPVWEQTQDLEPIYRCNKKGEIDKIAEGFELTEIVTGLPSGKTRSWSELCTVIRSIKYALAIDTALHQRLKQAKKAIADLTRPLSSYKCITTLD